MKYGPGDENNVIYADFCTTMDIDPDDVLNAALGKLGEVVLIGTNQDGTSYVASSTGDTAAIMLYLERARHKLNRMLDNED